MIYDLGERRVELRGDNYVADNATVIGSVVLGHAASGLPQVIGRFRERRFIAGLGDDAVVVRRLDAVL